MLSEVEDQYVDISVAVYAWNAERDALVDFTPGIGFTTIALMIRRHMTYLSDTSIWVGKYYFIHQIVF